MSCRRGRASWTSDSLALQWICIYIYIYIYTMKKRFTTMMDQTNNRFYWWRAPIYRRVGPSFLCVHGCYCWSVPRPIVGARLFTAIGRRGTTRTWLYLVNTRKARFYMFGRYDPYMLFTPTGRSTCSCPPRTGTLKIVRTCLSKAESYEPTHLPMLMVPNLESL